jgi:cell division septal protein FtsQ
VVPATSRLQERARSHRADRRRRLLHRAGQGLLILLPVLGVAWVVLASSWLALDRVQVTGTGRLQPAQVVAAVEVATGTPLARIDTARWRSGSPALAPVADVAVRRDWPGTLEVTVTERTGGRRAGRRRRPAGRRDRGAVRHRAAAARRAW